MGEATARQGERQGDFIGGKYLLGDCLGVGGMGEVYRATNVSLGRNVAVKILNKEHTANEDDVLRFLREARAAAAVRHPNVVDVLDVARDDDGTPFIVQELLSGEDLEQYLGTRGSVSEAEAIEIMIPVADAVAAAHERDVVHRDLKPANIFLAREGNKIIPKVLDFGACLYQTVGGLSAKERRMLIGTPHYMAPEQITTAAEIDARADVWAMGVILWELVAGETPFESEDGNTVLKYVRTRQIPPLRTVAPEVSPELEQLVARCLDRDRKRRFADANAARSEMAKIRKEPTSRARIDTRPEMEAVAAVKDAPAKARVPSLVMSARPTKRRGASLLTLSAPGDSVEPPGPPTSEERPIESPRSPSARPTEPPIVAPVAMPRQAGPPSTPMGLDLDEPGRESEPSLDLDFEPPSSRSKREMKTDSLPPVLDPRAAGPTVTGVTRASNPPLRKSARPPAPMPELFGDRPRNAPLGPPSLHKHVTLPTLIDPQKPWPMTNLVAFNAWVFAPAIALFIGLKLAPFVLVPLGRAMRGESPLASGAFAVIALVGAAALATRALGASRNVATIIATCGAVLLGIIMIIVTFAASESAELGVSPAIAGVVPFVAPIVPLGLGVAAWQRAKAVWRSRYERREAVMFTALTSLMVLLALELGPVGAVLASTAPTATRSGN